MNEVGLPISALDTPVLWVDLDRLESNIASLARHFKTAGVQWRPHIKSLKIPAVAQMAIDAGAIGVTCAKLGEAEVMAAAGIKDILIANQIVGPKKVTRLVNLRSYTDVKVAVDNPDNVTELGAAACSQVVTLGVVIEVDVGLKRAGVQPGRDAVELARLIHTTHGLEFLGFMAWEGHATLITEPEAKRQAIETSIALLIETAVLSVEAGLPAQIVSAGGSATAEHTPFIAGITEVQAGGAVFSDVLYRMRGVTNLPALLVRSMVTSRPAPDRVIFDCGFKTLPAWNVSPQLIGVEGVKSIRMSAEHATVTLEAPNTAICVGDVFDFIVGYGDFTVFLHDQLYGIRNGHVEVVWDIVGRGKVR